MRGEAACALTVASYLVVLPAIPAHIPHPHLLLPNTNNERWLQGNIHALAKSVRQGEVVAKVVEWLTART